MTNLNLIVFFSDKLTKKANTSICRYGLKSTPSILLARYKTVIAYHTRNSCSSFSLSFLCLLTLQKSIIFLYDSIVYNEYYYHQKLKFIKLLKLHSCIDENISLEYLSLSSVHLLHQVLTTASQYN